MAVDSAVHYTNTGGATERRCWFHRSRSADASYEQLIREHGAEGLQEGSPARVSRRVSSFRGLPPLAPMPDCLDFGWRTRVADYQGPATRSPADRFTLHSREGELRWRVFRGANAVDRAAASRMPCALMRNATAGGGGWLLKHVREHGRVGNMATPRRSPLWPFVAYGALALVMLAMSDWPIDAKGRPDTHRATAMPREPPDSEREIDRSRAAERGRGRQATSPWRIPWRGWKDILWRAYEKMNDNRLLAVAAGVVFYTLLALFPAVTAFVSLYGLVADASTIDRHLSLAAGILPSGAVDILHEQLTRLTSSRTSALSFGFVFGLLFALWSANSGTKAVIDGLNVAYGEAEKRSFICLNLISLVFTLGAFLSLTLAVGAVVVAPIVLAHLGLGGVADTIVRILRWPALVAFVIIGLAILYRYGPSRREARWTWLSVGSAAAAVGWLVTSALFSWYIANFGTYDATYGSLGAAIGMMMWMWISMIVVLLGAQLNAEIEHQTSKDSTVGPDKPLGRRGAVKADTIGAAQN